MANGGDQARGVGGADRRGAEEEEGNTPSDDGGEEVGATEASDGGEADGGSEAAGEVHRESGDQREDNGEVDPPEDDCAQMQPDPCIAAPGCVLELVDAEALYRCRGARDVCEREVEAGKCAGVDGCQWYPGDCYCPANVDCDCGDGPPPMCRMAVGVCEPRVRVVGTGGLCQEGFCRDEAILQGRRHLVFDDETAGTPVYGILEPEIVAPIEALLGDIDPAELDPDGYGECCNGHADGTDWYVTFMAGGEAVGPEIRVSDWQAAPPALHDLITRILREGRRLLEAGGDGEQCAP